MSSDRELTFLRQRYASQPFEVSIETLALCNAACSFCPYPTLERQGTKLPMDLITHMIGQMKSWTEPFFISPFKVNEPLLDVRMPEICAGIEQELPLAKIRLFTNGSPLTAAVLEWIGALTSLDGLWISLNSCDAQEYGDLMKLSYEITATRLDRLHRGVQEGTFPHNVTVSRVATDDSQKNLEFVRSVARRWPRFQPCIIKRDGWLGYVEPSNSRIPRSGCARWWELNITAEAKAVLCCMDGKGEYVLGDAAAQPLLEIYNQPHLQERRLRARTREGIEPCARCTY